MSKTGCKIETEYGSEDARKLKNKEACLQVNEAVGREGRKEESKREHSKQFILDPLQH